MSDVSHTGMDTFALDGELTLSMSGTQEELETLVMKATVGCTRQDDMGVKCADEPQRDGGIHNMAWIYPPCGTSRWLS